MRLKSTIISSLLFSSSILITPTLSFATGASADTGNGLLKVLIPQNVITLNAQKVAAIKKLAPNLEQIHFRLEGATPPYSQTTINRAIQNIVQIRQAYQSTNPNLLIGFHPDDSKWSYGSWGCGSGDVACVFTHSIQLMNAINKAYKAYIETHPSLKISSVGYNIFSIEQSYVELNKNQSIANQKSCLSGKIVPGFCSTSEEVANPAVQYGNVPGSCGGPSEYGLTGFDYGYYQMYNVGHNWTYNPGDAETYGLTADLFPNGVIPTTDTNLYVLDAYNADKPPKGVHYPYFPANVKKLNQPSSKNISKYWTTIYEPQMLEPTNNINPTLAGNVLNLYVLKHYPNSTSSYPCQSVIPPQSKRYFTLSGEEQFLGSPGWRSENIGKLLTQLNSKLSPKRTTGKPIPFAIWSYDTMMPNLLSNS